MKAVFLLFASALAFASTLRAQPSLSNDIGRPDVPSSSTLTGPIVPAGIGPICPAIGGVVSSFTGRNTQSGRLFRNAIPSTCLGKVFPGIYPAGTYNYETYTYTNANPEASCVRVGFNPNPTGATSCGTNAHMSAYAGSYNPENPHTNYLGDVGYSQSQPFTVQIPGDTQLVLAVTNTQDAATCSFAFEVIDLPCTPETTADLTVDLFVSPPNLTVTPGGGIYFFLHVWNAGPDVTQDINVSFQLAVGLKFSEAAVVNNGGHCTSPPVGSAGTVTCTFDGILAPNTRRVVSVFATTETAGGTAAVVARASSPTFDPMPASNVAKVSVTIGTGGGPVGVSVPTQSTLGLLLLCSLLAGLGWLARRRRRI